MFKSLKERLKEQESNILEELEPGKTLVQKEHNFLNDDVESRIQLEVAKAKQELFLLLENKELELDASKQKCRDLETEKQQLIVTYEKLKNSIVEEKKRYIECIKKVNLEKGNIANDFNDFDKASLEEDKDAEFQELRRGKLEALNILQKQMQEKMAAFELEKKMEIENLNIKWQERFEEKKKQYEQEYVSKLISEQEEMVLMVEVQDLQKKAAVSTLDSCIKDLNAQNLILKEDNTRLNNDLQTTKSSLNDLLLINQDNEFKISEYSSKHLILENTILELQSTMEANKLAYEDDLRLIKDNSSKEISDLKCALENVLQEAKKDKENILAREVPQPVVSENTANKFAVQSGDAGRETSNQQMSNQEDELVRLQALAKSMQQNEILLKEKLDSTESKFKQRLAEMESNQSKLVSDFSELIQDGQLKTQLMTEEMMKMQNHSEKVIGRLQKKISRKVEMLAELTKRLSNYEDVDDDLDKQDDIDLNDNNLPISSINGKVNGDFDDVKDFFGVNNANAFLRDDSISYTNVKDLEVIIKDKDETINQLLSKVSELNKELIKKSSEFKNLEDSFWSLQKEAKSKLNNLKDHDGQVKASDLELVMRLKEELVNSKEEVQFFKNEVKKQFDEQQAKVKFMIEKMRENCDQSLADRENLLEIKIANIERESNLKLQREARQHKKQTTLIENEKNALILQVEKLSNQLSQMKTQYGIDTENLTSSPDVNKISLSRTNSLANSDTINFDMDTVNQSLALNDNLNLDISDSCLNNEENLHSIVKPTANSIEPLITENCNVLNNNSSLFKPNKEQFNLNDISLSIAHNREDLTLKDISIAHNIASVDINDCSVSTLENIENHLLDSYGDTKCILDENCDDVLDSCGVSFGDNYTDMTMSSDDTRCIINDNDSMSNIFINDDSISKTSATMNDLNEYSKILPISSKNTKLSSCSNKTTIHPKLISNGEKHIYYGSSDTENYYKDIHSLDPSNPSCDNPDYHIINNQYLRNVLYQYMLGKETKTLAKVICMVMQFNKDQTDQILKSQSQYSKPKTFVEHR